MSDILKGVLIYNEWFESMQSLSPKDYKTLMIAIYNAQINNVPPPEFTGRSRIVATMIFPCIERRKSQSEHGYLGAVAKHAKDKEKQLASSTSANGTASGTASGTANGQSKEKKNKAEYSYSRVERKRANAPAAKEQSSFDLDDFFEAAVRRSLGKTSG